MAFVIGVLNQKGGSGKTTITTNLGCAFQQAGKQVLLIDSDPQGSLRDWHEAGGGDVIPVVALDRETLLRDIGTIKGYDLILIDGAPQLAKMSAAAVRASSLVLIPVQPSPYDIWACADLVDIIKARQEVTGGMPCAVFVISRAIKNTKLSHEVSAALAEYAFPVLRSYTTQRISYPTTAANGRTVMHEPESAAASEIQMLRDEIMEMMNR